MTIITSAADLWTSLHTRAGLELRLKRGGPGRDADIEDALRAAFAVPANAPSLAAWLVADAASSHPKVTVERFLVEVLRSQGGFAQMMQDILDVLVMAEARQASHQLSIEFRFDRVSAPIRATLEQFREFVNRTQQVLERRPKLPDAPVMWGLSSALRDSFGSSRANPPAGFPPVAPIARTGNTEIDAKLGHLRGLVLDFRTLWTRYGSTREEVQNAAGGLPRGSKEAQVLRGQLGAALDNWDMSVLDGAHGLSTRVLAGRLTIEDALTVLNEAFSGVEWADVWVEHTVNELLDVLNLPAWRRRHELYSVWVGTRMLKVVERQVPDMRFHAVDGVLSFEFGGSRLATFNWKNRQFDIWAELRSALVGKSAKRKTGIQPDFRVLMADISKSVGQQTTYVLECKHYLNANTANFTQAAADYARSCPNAAIHIVNHGPADEPALIAALADELRDRSRFIGNATPLDEARTGALSNAIQKAVFPGLPPPSPSPSAPTQTAGKPVPPVAPGSVGHILLEWDDSLRDMDLALHILGPEGEITQSIDFRDKGALDGPPFARLDMDTMRGPGVERIDISAWHFGRYALVATNFSKTGAMTPQALRCSIVTDKGATHLYCPAGLLPTCYEWTIAELHVRAGSVTVVQE